MTSVRRDGTVPGALSRVWVGGAAPSPCPLVTDRHARLRLLPEAALTSVRAAKPRVHANVRGAVAGHPGPDRCPPATAWPLPPSPRSAALTEQPDEPFTATAPLRPTQPCPACSVGGTPRLPAHCVARARTLPAHCSKSPRGGGSALLRGHAHGALGEAPPSPECSPSTQVHSATPVQVQGQHQWDRQQGPLGSTSDWD